MKRARAQAKGEHRKAQATAPPAGGQNELGIKRWLRAAIPGLAVTAASEPQAASVSPDMRRPAGAARQPGAQETRAAPASDLSFAPPPLEPDRDLATLCARLDDLTRQLGRLLSHVERSETERAASAEPVDDPLAQAMAEIAARQHLLDQTETAVPSMFPVSEPPQLTPVAPAPDLSGLEQQLKFITTQLEILRAPSRADELVAELRGELASISDTLEKVVPRSAFEMLEAEVRAIGARLDMNRGDVADSAVLHALEQGLGEIRDALRGLAPGELDEAVRTLSGKIDQISAAGADPVLFRQLDSAVAALRGIVAQVASGDAVAALVREVRLIGEKIEQAAAAPAELGPVDRDLLRGLEEQVRGIVDALGAQNARPDRAVGPLIEPLIETLAEKLDAFDLLAKESAAIEPIKQHIDLLGEKIDRLQAAPDQPAALIEQRLDHLAETIAQQPPPAPPSLAPIEQRLDHLAETIERLNATDAQQTPPAPPSLAPIEQRLDQLAETIERLNATDAQQPPPAPSLAPIEQRLDQLAATIERLNLSAAQSTSLAQPAVTLLGVRLDQLAETIDRINVSSAQSPALMSLEERLDRLAETIDRLGRSGAPSPALMSLDERMRIILAKLDRLEENPRSPPDIGPLEQRFAQLSDKLVASEGQLGALQALERGMAELLAHIDEPRRPPRARPRGAETVERRIERPIAPELETDEPARCNEDRRAQPPRAAFPPDDAETAVAPERNEPPWARPSGPPPTGISPPAAAVNGSAPTRLTAAQPSPILPLREPATDDAGLPPDAPIEPGSGPPRNLNGRGAGDRNPAPGQAAMAGAKPQGPRSSFIVAARRAAQAASEQHSHAATNAHANGSPAPGTIGKTLAARVKSLFVSSSLVLIGLGFAGIALSSSDLFVERRIRAVEQPATRALTQVAPTRPVLGRPAQADDGVTGLVLPSPHASAGKGLPTLTDTLAVTPGSGAQDANHDANRESSVAPASPPARTASADVTGAIPPARESARAPAPAAPLPPESVQPWSDPLPAGVATKPLLAGIAGRNPAAAYEIALRYAEGRGAPADLAAAAAWFARAAEGGLAPAQFRLGSMYEKGLGVRKNLAEARRLYLAAAAKGNASAMHNLAVLYAEGVDGKPDFAAAVEWFGKAAEYGVADSQYNLAVLHARGIGVAQNLTEAFKWFSILARNGDQDAAKKRDDVAEHLNQQMLAAARLAAETFVAKPQPEAATTAPAPPGGWDDASAPARPKPRARHSSQQSAAL